MTHHEYFTIATKKWQYFDTSIEHLHEVCDLASKLMSDEACDKEYLEHVTMHLKELMFLARE